MFWGENLLRRRVEAEKLIEPFDSKRIDKAAYRLSVGPEVYVSPTGEPGDARNKPKTRLDDGEPFAIPAGQFGFILTEERVTVPNDALAFISIRATYKFRGLVNVSGFHVDPDFKGRLLFSVFNAGPSPVHLARGDECFLIWYAELREPGDSQPKISRYDGIPSELTGPLANGLQSLASLDSRINQVEREQAVIKWASALALGALLTIVLKDCSISRQPDAPKASTSAQVQSSPAPPDHK
jgi:dCTP deaminase